MSQPSLEAFEAAVAGRDGEAALTQALLLLRSVDDRFGRVDAIAGAGPDDARQLSRVATRFAAAFGELICDPATALSDTAYEQLAAQHRWIELLFAASGFGSADHLLPRLAVAEGGGRRVPPQNLARFFLIYSAAAGMKLDPEECLKVAGPGAMAAFLGYLGSRFCFTDAGHAFREQLLAWLPERLDGVRLGGLALQAIAAPYMHCSYATGPRKHAIKASLMAQMRRACLEAGCREWSPTVAPPASDARPTIVVTTENFTAGHSIHRTHSRAVAALRERFRLVGFAHRQHVSPALEAEFDELVAFPTEGAFLDLVRQSAAAVQARAPAMVLHLGVGMSQFVIALASLRLAPVQAASFGHTATTASPAIDHMILPDDFVGDPACFTERLVRLPPAAMPYRRRGDVDYAQVRQRAEAARRPDQAVRIAVPASVMKLGPPVFDALARAAAAASAPVEFHAFPLGGAGLGHAELQRRLSDRLPMAVVNEELPYGDYLERLAACDFFVCPFPYGNMNSIVDAVLVGLPGVCLDGAEAHAHADGAYFRRLGFPPSLIAACVDDYVAAIARLASDSDWLAKCRRSARDADLDAAFFGGDARLFAAAVADLIGGA